MRENRQLATRRQPAERRSGPEEPATLLIQNGSRLAGAALEVPWCSACFSAKEPSPAASALRNPKFICIKTVNSGTIGSFQWGKTLSNIDECSVY